MSETVRRAASFMKANGLLLATAESCTAGLIAAKLAEVPGAGKMLDCAFVVYSIDAKKNCLGVTAETLERFNLTSEAVAREMALGALERSRANSAIANTGVADSTDDEIEPGTQCFAWAFAADDAEPAVYCETRVFHGDRNAIRDAAAEFALERLTEKYRSWKET